MVEQTGSEIAAARDELQRAESAHQIAHLSYTRLQEVAKREPGLIPQQEVDESRSRDLVAEAQVASAKSKLRVEENRTLVAKAEEARLRTLAQLRHDYRAVRRHRDQTIRECSGR